jgi:hypothetical protein
MNAFFHSPGFSRLTGTFNRFLQVCLNTNSRLGYFFEKYSTLNAIQLTQFNKIEVINDLFQSV